MKKNNYEHLSEQIELQKKIIEDLVCRILLLEEELSHFKKEKRGVDICKTCGKLFLFTKAPDSCSEHD
jgi:hypothetical protein